MDMDLIMDINMVIQSKIAINMQDSLMLSTLYTLGYHHKRTLTINLAININSNDNNN